MTSPSTGLGMKWSASFCWMGDGYGENGGGGLLGDHEGDVVEEWEVSIRYGR